jgi:crossover junction endodeoxyribonuclease RusA
VTTPPRIPHHVIRLDANKWEVSVFVPGRPAPQGSKRHVGNGVMVESSKALAPWRTTVAWHLAQAHRSAPLDGPLFVVLEFVMPRPAACPKRSTPAAVKRPDLDKLIRACLDAGSSVVWRDDSQIVRIDAKKRIALPDEQPGAWVRVAVDGEFLTGAA